MNIFRMDNLNYKTRVMLSFIANTDFIYSKIKDLSLSIKHNQKIPNVVYQTTKSRWLPKKFIRDIEKFRSQNPDFNFIVFDQKSMTNWMKLNYRNELILEAYLSSKFGVMQSDIFKYCYGYKEGGISIDISKFLSKPLNKVFPDLNYTMILSQQSGKIDTNKIIETEYLNLNLHGALLINWCFATSANNPMLLSVIRHIEHCFSKSQGQTFKEPKIAIWENTGPVAFNRGLLNYFEAKIPKCVYISEIDFGENEWPKFKSANLVNVFNKHYTEHKNSKIFT